MFFFLGPDTEKCRDTSPGPCCPASPAPAASWPRHPRLATPRTSRRSGRIGWASGLQPGVAEMAEWRWVKKKRSPNGTSVNGKWTTTRSFMVVYPYPNGSGLALFELMSGFSGGIRKAYPNPATHFLSKLATTSPNFSFLPLQWSSKKSVKTRNAGRETSCAIQNYNVMITR